LPKGRDQLSVDGHLAGQRACKTPEVVLRAGTGGLGGCCGGSCCCCGGCGCGCGGGCFGVFVFGAFAALFARCFGLRWRRRSVEFDGHVEGYAGEGAVEGGANQVGVGLEDGEVEDIVVDVVEDEVGLDCQYLGKI